MGSILKEISMSKTTGEKLDTAFAPKQEYKIREVKLGVSYPTQTLTSGSHTWKLTLRDNTGRENDITEHIEARSVTAAACLVYEKYPHWSRVYRVVRVEEVQ